MELRFRQSMFMAVVGGLLAACMGAILWATVAAWTDCLTCMMALVMGALAGGGVRLLGHGLERSYGYLGAAMSLFGCVLGGTFSAFVLHAEQPDLSWGQVLTQIDLARIWDRWVTTFHPIDVLFYLIAMCEGYYFSFRKITRVEMDRIMHILGR